MFEKTHGLLKSMVIDPSDVIKKEYDVLIVDEAHRLTRRVSITNYRDFDNANSKLDLGNKGTQLNWILKSSKHQVLFYDSEQSIKPTEWSFEETDRGPTLRPSVGNWQQKCQSHYLITRGEIKWANKWTPEQIIMGQHDEEERLRVHYEALDYQRGGVLQRFWQWLKDCLNKRS